MKVVFDVEFSMHLQLSLIYAQDTTYFIKNIDVEYIHIVSTCFVH